MVSILTEMSQADVNSTLQILGEHGVTAQDLKFLRKYRGTFAGQVAAAIKSGPDLRIRANLMGQASFLALEAVEKIEDIEILKSIYETSLLPEVWVAVLKKVAKISMDELYHLIRVYTGPDRRRARLAGARKLSEYYLHNLRKDDGYISRDTVRENRLIADQVEAERILLGKE